MSKKPRFRAPCDIQHVKQSEKVHHSTSIILFHHFGKNWVGKYPSHWLPMSSILYVIGRIHRNRFNCNDLRDKNIFLNVLLLTWNLHEMSNNLKQKMTFKGYVFSELETAKDVVSQISKKLRFRTPCDSQHVKEFGNIHHRTSIKLFHPSGKNWVGKFRY